MLCHRLHTSPNGCRPFRCDTLKYLLKHHNRPTQRGLMRRETIGNMLLKMPSIHIRFTSINFVRINVSVSDRGWRLPLRTPALGAESSFEYMGFSEQQLTVMVPWALRKPYEYDKAFYVSCNNWSGTFQRTKRSVGLQALWNAKESPSHSQVLFVTAAHFTSRDIYPCANILHCRKLPDQQESYGNKRSSRKLVKKVAKLSQWR